TQCICHRLELAVLVVLVSCNVPSPVCYAQGLAVARARRRDFYAFWRCDRGAALRLVVRIHGGLIKRIGHAEHAAERVVFGPRGAVEWIGHYDGTPAVLVGCGRESTRSIDRFDHAAKSVVRRPAIRVDPTHIVSLRYHSPIQIVVELLGSALTVPSRAHL